MIPVESSAGIMTFLITRLYPDERDGYGVGTRCDCPDEEPSVDIAERIR